MVIIICSHTYTHARARTYTHATNCINTHTRTHARTHARRHAHSHAHTHTTYPWAQPIQRINLLHQMPLANTAKGWVTGHSSCTSQHSWSVTLYTYQVNHYRLYTSGQPWQTIHIRSTITLFTCTSGPPLEIIIYTHEVTHMNQVQQHSL